jgi:putative ABC transport system ATP-binding protein
VIEFRHVSKQFGADATAVRAVDDLSFLLPQGAFWSVMGPSGAGKSTVLHLAAGLTPPTTGEVLIEGRDVTHMSDAEAATLRRRRVGYLLQTANLMPFLTVERNVGLPLLIDGVPPAEREARVADALGHVNIAHRAGHLPSHLSGGENQRVALARALVIRPAILLADEPTGNLDRNSGRVVMDLIRSINQDLGVTVLLVTHDPVFAAYADRVLRLEDGRLTEDTDLTETDALPDVATTH